MRGENEGQIRILEAFFAVIVIFSAFAVTAGLPVSHDSSRSQNLASVGLQALMKLDSDGSLGKQIDDGNWTALREDLSLMLPTGISFNLTVYDDQMRQVNTEVISNAEFGSQTIAFTEYVCASQNSDFRIYILRLHLAVAA